jgi:hypothetical protein
MVASFVVAVATADGLRTIAGGRLGGDWPSFYAAGTIARSDLAHLYDAARQRSAQQPFLGGTLLPFLYPPFVAQALALLVPLGFATSFVVHAAIMLLALALAVRLARPLLPNVAGPTLFAAAVAHPLLYRATFGGQNTPLAMLLLVVVARGIVDRRPAWAGLGLALLAFKPGHACVVGVVLLAMGELAAVGAAALGSLALWAASAVRLGPLWPAVYASKVREFALVDAKADFARSVDLGSLVRGLDLPSAVGWWAALVPAIALLAALVPSIRAARSVPGSWLGLVAAALPLVGPRVGFYDAGIGFLAMAAAVDRRGARMAPLVVASVIAEAFAAWRPVPLRAFVLAMNAGWLVVMLALSRDRAMTTVACH